MSWNTWKPYVPAAQRRRQVLQEKKKLEKKGIELEPVVITGRTIARSFWGQSWCKHLESFSDFNNRLPRGRTYVRSGAVCHLDIMKSEISALVCGSELYTVKIAITPLSRKKWNAVKQRCAGKIGSLLELLQGKLSANVMAVVTDRNHGLFPLAGDINMQCSCPDWALLCKHLAAVLYGVGARLDEKPELLFLLRGVDQAELIDNEIDFVHSSTGHKSNSRRMADNVLEDVFGIEFSESVAPAGEEPTASSRPKTPQARAKQTTPNDEHPLTSQAVAALRKKFGLSQHQFAKLLGVSASSVIQWENKTGELHLRKRSQDAWKTIKGLTKRQAWNKLQKTTGTQ